MFIMSRPDPKTVTVHYPLSDCSSSLQQMTISHFLADSFLVETTLTPDLLSLAGLEQAFLLVRERLRNFAGDPAFSAKLALAFGGSFDGQAAQGLVQAWQQENFGAIPILEVIGGSQLNGAIGAFGFSKNRIYLSKCRGSTSACCPV